MLLLSEHQVMVLNNRWLNAPTSGPQIPTLSLHFPCRTLRYLQGLTVERCDYPGLDHRNSTACPGGAKTADADQVERKTMATQALVEIVIATHSDNQAGTLG